MPQPGTANYPCSLGFHPGRVSSIKGIRPGVFGSDSYFGDEVHSIGCGDEKANSVALEKQEWKEKMKQLFIWLIRGYQKFISPLKPPCCRFYPTCSSYAVQVLQKFGVFRGSYLALRRILRCNPFHLGGFDYPPDKFSFFYRKFRPYVTTPRDLPEDEDSR